MITSIRKLEKIKRKMDDIKTTPAPNLMLSSGVASEKMKIAMIRAL
jgi:hypothetical protein